MEFKKKKYIYIYSVPPHSTLGDLSWTSKPICKSREKG